MKKLIMAVVLLLCGLYANAETNNVSDSTNAVTVPVGSGGDLNDDGKVSITDVVMFFHYFNEININDDDYLVGAVAFDKNAMDASNNVHVNLYDMNVMINWILNGKKE